MPLRRRLVDYHVHSTHSCDGKSSISEMCQKATELGIAEIGFSEHLDLDPVDCCYGFLNYDRYTSDVKEAQGAFKGGLVIRKGVELTYQRYYEDDLREWLRGRRFDFIIGSVHYLDHEVIGYRLAASDNVSETYDAYLSEVSRSIESGLFNIVGHFDLLRRYIGNPRNGLSSQRYLEKVRMILRETIKRNMCLEVNSKGLREAYGNITPSREIVNEYIGNGGRLISVGSDAHSAEEMDRGIEEVFDFLAKYDEDRVKMLFE